MIDTAFEFEVVVRTRQSEHDPVKAVMIHESSDNLETKALAIHGLGA